MRLLPIQFRLLCTSCIKVRSSLVSSSLLGCIVTLFAWQAHGQSLSVPKEVRSMNTIERLNFGGHTTPGNMMPTMPMEKPDIVGERYLNQTWNRANILLYNSEKVLEGYPIKLDVLTNELDIRLNEDVKQPQVIKGNKVRSFVWLDSLSGEPNFFVNGKEIYDGDGVPFVGFFHVMIDGKAMLMRHTTAEILKSNYNVALSVGNKNHQVVQNDILYYQIAEKLHKLPKRMKNLLAVFPDSHTEVKSFAKKNRLIPQKDHHVEALFRYYNSLHPEDGEKE